MMALSMQIKEYRYTVTSNLSKLSNKKAMITAMEV